MWGILSCCYCSVDLLAKRIALFECLGPYFLRDRCVVFTVLLQSREEACFLITCPFCVNPINYLDLYAMHIANFVF